MSRDVLHIRGDLTDQAKLRIWNCQEGGLGCRGSTVGARDSSVWIMIRFPVPVASSCSLSPFFWGFGELVTLNWPSVWMWVSVFVWSHVSLRWAAGLSWVYPASRLPYEINQEEMDGSNKMIAKSLQNLLKNNCKITTVTNSLWTLMESSTVFCKDGRRGLITNKFKLLLFLVNCLSEPLKVPLKVLICSLIFWKYVLIPSFWRVCLSSTACLSHMWVTCTVLFGITSQTIAGDCVLFKDTRLE